jgi:hypothetical protein
MNLNKQLQKVVLGEDENGKEITLGILETENETKIYIEILEKFAIDFAQWCIKWRVEFIDDTREGMLYTYGGMHQKYTMSQILEIYKKKRE